MLYVCFLQAPITGAPQAKGAYSLGQCAFDSRTAFIALRAFVTGIPGAGRLKRLVLRVRRQSETTALLLRLRTDRACGTGTALLRAAGDDNRGMAITRHELVPTAGGSALGTHHGLVLPIHGKVLDRIGAFHMRLPALDRTRWVPQRNPMRLLTREEQLGIDIGSIDQMLRRREVFVHEGLMDHLGTTGFVDGRRGRVYMRQQMRVSRVTRFADMHHIPGPGRTVFVAVARVHIVRRFNPFSRAW